ncbi:MAG: hypothetical protein N2053_08045 [Chitinispirillaceae bacterium]|nr:hypothetical protein [Chitinispirillaceae bacterium]
MNILLLDKNQIDRDNPKMVTIYGERVNEIISSFTKKKCEKLRVGIINGQVGIASLISFDKTSITLSLHLTEEPPPPLNITLILALPRPTALKRILEGVASM